MKTIKKNFWNPFLFGCVGLFVATIVFAAVSFQEPEPPGTPFVVDWGMDYCEMVFTPPVSDGGSPITHYIVQARDARNGIWVEKGKYLPNTGDRIKIECTVLSLIGRHTYEFRAIAVNVAGKSRPSGVSKSITMKER